MRRWLFAALWLVVCFTAPATAHAEEIRVLSVGSLQRGLERIAESFTSATGHDVVIEVGTTPVVGERLASGETFDVVIATSAVIAEAASRGLVRRDESRLVGRVGVGIAVRSQVRADDPPGADALRTLLVDADTVAYNRGSSGVYARSMIESLGISDQIRSKVNEYANGGQVLSHVIEGTGVDLGLAPLTEIRANADRGVRLVRLPEAVQNYTSYDAAIGTNAPDAAMAFVRFLATPEARELFADTGVE